MGVDIRVDGSAYWDVPSLKVAEYSTPLDVADTFGGAGQIEFTVTDVAAARSLLNKTVSLTGDRGATEGVVRSMSGDRATVNLAAPSRLAALVADRTAAPHVGTLETYLTYLFGLCGIDSGIDVDASIADYEVVALGFRDNVWGQLKKFCAAYGVEVALVDGAVTVRPPRTVRATRRAESEYVWALDQSNLAQVVEAWFYPAEPVTDALVVGVGDLYPVANLAAGEVHEFDVALPFSLSSVDQPVAADAVAFDHDSSSTYSVLDAFDEPVPAAAWEAGGGRVTVEIAEDTRGLRVTVVGSQDRIRAPYRLAAVSSIGVEYSTLRVVGSGVGFDRQKYQLMACNDSRATAEVGAEVDNEYLGSWGHAHLALLHSVRRHSGGLKTVSGSASMSGDFGELAGARLLDDFDEYRIRSVNITPAGVGFSAESDTTVADVDAVWAGHTVAQWDALWAGRPVAEFDLRPLTPLSGVAVIPDGLYPGLDTFPSSTTFPGA